MAWSDPETNKLVASFVAATGEVTQMETGRDAGSRLFQKIATRHVRGLQTTQGTYIVTPGGKLLASNHTLESLGIRRFLQRGLKKWARLSTEERLGPASRKDAKTTESSLASGYPENGLILSVVLRKFPNGRESRRRGFVAWNQDFAWFRKEEAASFLPENPAPGTRHDVPKSLVRRLARFHFTDTVRAYADPWSIQHLKEARLSSIVLQRAKDRITLRLEGSVRMSQSDRPRYAPRQRLARLPNRSYDATLLGFATFDLTTRRFTRFELIAHGNHSGGGERSGGGTVPMSVALTLSDDTPMTRVAPLHVARYGWN